MKKIVSFLLTALFAFSFSACSDDDDNFLKPSKTSVKMEGEGGTHTFTFDSGDWRIAEVVNKNGDQKIFGEIFDKEGALIRENTILELDGLGKLDAFWSDKGFSISRSKANSMEVELAENATGKEFSFGVVLENGAKSREIVITQKVSKGYTFENIEYFLAENDADKLSMKKGTHHMYDFIPSRPITVYPITGGANIQTTSYFESNDDYAFVWFKGNLPEVEVPTYISDGEIYLSGEKRSYGQVSKIDFKEETGVEMLLPAGKSSFYVELEWRLRQVSYRLTMKNNRTGNLKTVEGKWLETTPTGKYEIKFDD